MHAPCDICIIWGLLFVFCPLYIAFHILVKLHVQDLCILILSWQIGHQRSCKENSLSEGCQWLRQELRARDMNQYDRECMKIAMLKQEEIFRYQVQELHRLYKIQKLLMTRHHELLDYFALPGPAKKNSTLTVELEESDLELKLAAGNDRAPSKKNSTQLAYDSGSSFSGRRSNEEGEDQATSLALPVFQTEHDRLFQIVIDL
ncbi:uncharacterized protein LOC121970789 [Zingiber officinale]|uniref:uncharacterized protein LOC121970789 n=1 Tax=Zingiber officinale TaxID=94328 RepID=UPI001C4D5106|nr:uncharacterized protein LOC121970789 [Zingiber officinale]